MAVVILSWWLMFNWFCFFVWDKDRFASTEEFSFGGLGWESPEMRNRGWQKKPPGDEDPIRINQSTFNSHDWKIAIKHAQSTYMNRITSSFPWISQMWRDESFQSYFSITNRTLILWSATAPTSEEPIRWEEYNLFHITEKKGNGGIDNTVPFWTRSETRLSEKWILQKRASICSLMQTFLNGPVQDALFWILFHWTSANFASSTAAIRWFSLLMIQTMRSNLIDRCRMATSNVNSWFDSNTWILW